MEAHKHAEALGDSHALGMVCVWQTKMEVLANNRELAIQYARMAMEHGGDLRMWRTLLVAAAEVRKDTKGVVVGNRCHATDSKARVA